MADNDYHFITTWRIPGTLSEVMGILSNAADLPRWWPSVYLEVKELEPGDERGLGKVVDLYTKGWLPYTLRWQFRVTESHDLGFTLEAWGDFAGRGVWSFAPDGPDVLVTYDWKVRADKPLLRDYSWLMKPIFSANHRWAMVQGERSLLLELARRRARSDLERDLIPSPPGPTRWWPAPALLLIAVGVLVLWLISRRRTR